MTLLQFRALQRRARRQAAGPSAHARSTADLDAWLTVGAFACVLAALAGCVVIALGCVG